MKTFESFLDALRARAGSDARAAPLVGIRQSSFSQWRRRHALPDDVQAARIAEVLDLDQAYVLAIIHGERAKTKAVRATWQRVAEAFGKAAALAAVAVAPALTSPDAQARFNNSQNVPTSDHQVRGQNTQCPTSRRRRASSFADTILHTLGLSAQRLSL